MNRIKPDGRLRGARFHLFTHFEYPQFPCALGAGGDSRKVAGRTISAAMAAPSLLFPIKSLLYVLNFEMNFSQSHPQLVQIVRGVNRTLRQVDRGLDQPEDLPLRGISQD